MLIFNDLQRKCKKKMQKNFHISKIFYTFASDFKNKPIKGDGNTLKTASKLWYI